MQSARILRHSKGRKAEKQIGHAGNEDRSPERYPARGIKERASKWRDSGADSGRKTSPNKRCWPFRRKVGGMLRRPPRKSESLAGSERLMEEVCELENCKPALQRVKANKGSPGVDGMTVDELPE